MRSVSLFFIALACLSLCHGQYPFPPNFEIDLDSDPRHRFDEVVTYFKPVLIELNDVVQANFASSNAQWFMDFVFYFITRTVYPEMAEEIMGMADVLGITDGQMFTVQCYYDLSVLCTSIVARDPNGHILLGHNLDYEPADLLVRAYYTSVFKKNGKVHFKCSGIAGYVGVLACLKDDDFAITMNARYVSSVPKLVINLLLGRPTLTWVLRHALTYAANYKEAYSIVTKTSALSGAYVIMAGIKDREGASITRDDNGVIGVQRLNSTTWFVAQCNVDPSEANNDLRTSTAIQRMKAIGPQNITLANMAGEVLLQPPNLRPITIASVLMSPEDSYIVTYITCGAEPAVILNAIRERKSSLNT